MSDTWPITIRVREGDTFHQGWLDRVLTLPKTSDCPGYLEGWEMADESGFTLPEVIVAMRREGQLIIEGVGDMTHLDTGVRRRAMEQ